MLRKYKVLDNEKVLLNTINLDQLPLAYNISNTALDSLTIIDSVFYKKGLSEKLIKGILFNSRFYEFSLDDATIKPTAITLVSSHENIDDIITDEIEDIIGIINIVNMNSVKSMAKTDRCFLIYGDKELQEFLGTEANAQIFLTNYQLNE